MPNLGRNFYPKLVQISSELGMNPEDLIAVMVSESGLKPDAVEHTYKGSGLVGFMPQTLKNLGFQGNWEDFIKLSGEEQLDYVKKLVKSFQGFNGGKPFNSAAQYYVANFWPVALRLPGIQQGNPNTIFIDSRPELTTDSAGNKWSKKYYDIGYKISADKEIGAYKANPLFDKDKKGNITYGDMMKQVEINKRNPLYLKAIADMRDSTGYSPSQDGKEKTSPNLVAQQDQDEDIFENYLSQHQDKDISEMLGLSEKPSQNISPQSTPSGPANIDNLLEEYMEKTKENLPYKQAYNKYLPSNNILIKIKSNNFTNAVEFGNILCNALDEELMSKAFVHADGENVEVACTISGPEILCYQAVKQLSSELTKIFKTATKKIGGVHIDTYCFLDSKSSLQPISLKTANIQHRNFLLKFI